MDIAVEIDGMPYRWAQAKQGQKLHLARVIWDHGFRVAHVSRCGRRVERWRATFNVPPAHGCKNCQRTTGR